MKTTTPRIAILALTLAAFAVLASGPSTRTVAGAKLTQPARAGSAPSTISTQARLAESYGKIPLSFEANQGQADPRAKFISRGSGYTLFLTGDEAVLALRKSEARSQKSGVRSAKPESGNSKFETRNSGQLSLLPTPESLFAGSDPRPPSPESQAPAVLRMKLVGADRAAKVTALDELPGKTNYFIGNDPKKWRTDVPTYAKVKYEGVYPGIDLVYYGNQRQLEYDFVVAPGADPKAITLAIETRNSKFETRQSKIENRKSKIDSNGDLVVQAEGGEVRFHKPVVYQPTADDANRKSKIQNRKLLDGRYVLTADNRVTFAIEGYDRSKPLVIDPTLVYSTYLGGSNADSGNGIAVDSSGNAYVAGITYSTDFPTAGAFQSTNPQGQCRPGGPDTNPVPCGVAFVTKLNASGTALVYSTYLGGSSGDNGSSIAVDSSGSAWVTGATASANFPVTANAFQPTLAEHGNCLFQYSACTDGFVTKLSATGNSLIYSTYLGGNSYKNDSGNSIAVDSSGNAYVTGETFSCDFPTTPGAYQASSPLACGGGGGTIPDGNPMAFAAKFTSAGQAVYSTYLDSPPGSDGSIGQGGAIGNGIAADSSGNAYVAGVTNTPQFPTTSGAFQTSCTVPTGGVYCSQTAFVTKFNPSGSALVFSTYLGGGNVASGPTVQSSGGGIALDSSDNVYVLGVGLPTTPGAFQEPCGIGAVNCDTFSVAKLNSAGSQLIYGTLFGDTGGCGADFPGGIAVDSSGDAIVTGLTYASNYPVTSNAIQSQCPSCSPPGEFQSGNAFVTELNPSGTGLLFSSYLGGDGNGGGNGIAVDSAGNAYITGFTSAANFPVTGGPQFVYGGGNSDAFISKIGLGTSSTVTLTPSILDFGNQPLYTTSAPRKITVTNSGSVQTNVPITINNGDFNAGFAETDNCGAGLAPGASCTINVTFAPTKTGTVNATLQVSDQADASVRSATLGGTGTAGVVSFSPGSLGFGSQVGTTSAPQSVTLQNTGSTTLTISSIAASSPFGETNNCGSSLAAGGSCSINVTFTPTTVNNFSGSLTVSDNAPVSPQAITLRGLSNSGPASLQPSSLTFGNELVGTTSTSQGVTLTNNGSAPMSIQSIAIFGSNSADFTQTNNCPIQPSTLAVKASCTIAVAFAPSVGGIRTSSLQVSDSASTPGQSVSLTGTGATPPTGGGSGPLGVVQVQNNIDTSGVLFTKYSVNITTNPGDLLVAFARESSNCQDNFRVTDSAGNPWSPLNSICESTAGPNIRMFYVVNSVAVSSVTVNFTTPGGVVKPGIMVMEVAGAVGLDNANGFQSVVTHDSSASVTISTSGSLSTSNANDILIFATDTAANQVPNASTSGGWTAGAGYAIPNNNLTIGASGSNIRMGMQFKVVSSVQAGATTSMNYSNAAWNGNIFAAFKGGSVASGSPAATLSPSSLTFASRPVGTTSTAQTVTLTNSGTTTLTNISAYETQNDGTEDFFWTTTCGSSLVAGASCTFSVTFEPQASGNRTGKMVVNDSASNSPQTASFSGTGTGIVSFPGFGVGLAQVQNNLDLSGTAFTTFTVNLAPTYPGDLLVAFVRESSNATDNFTVTDSAGQTWALTPSRYENESSTGPRIGMFYMANSAAVSSVTAHYTTSGGVIKPGIMVMEISTDSSYSPVGTGGSVSNPSGASVTTSTSASLSPPEITNIFIFATDTAGNQTGWTPGSAPPWNNNGPCGAGGNYLIPNNKVAVGASGSNARMAMQIAVVSCDGPGTFSTSMTYPNAAWNGNIFAAFK